MRMIPAFAPIDSVRGQQAVQAEARAVTPETAYQFGRYLRTHTPGQLMAAGAKGATMFDWLCNEALDLGARPVFSALESSGGFLHNWMVEVTYKGVTKKFWLGQDVKFVSRRLGMSPQEFARTVLGVTTGVTDLGNPENQATVAGWVFGWMLAQFEGEVPLEGLMASNEWDWAAQ